MQIKSKFFAVEGLDGAGKSTQIALLTNYFNARGIETRFVHFPRSQEGVFGDLIAKFLRGEFGDVKQVHPQLVALLFAEDRKAFAQTINEWQQSGHVVLVDRYVLSNIAFQCAKLTSENEKRELREWINMFEYEYNQIPKPDLSFYLDVPFAFTEKALTERRSGEERKYLNGKDDIHEKDFSLQLAVKHEYDVLVNTDNTITKITCYNKDNQMKSIADIHTEIISNIEKII
ncbi:dTMP kinase [Chitinophaga oryziterrae]|uniref:Thymidylate kinase n=1 Tax=Chitinophaga oryziterrae TaxID=1031224 RepID=A0A6N8JB73_9BACT|nr:dTMP kinase [Chitinophaga oryziterrae]MVT42535.1 dTMP kinase [Chitinophaga oryziterrae]